MGTWEPLFILLSVAAAGCGAWFGAYLREKGKRYATHEDMNKILDELRQTTRATEDIKAEISDDLFVRQKRWDLKLDFYTRILAALQALAKALQAYSVVNFRTHYPDSEAGEKQWEADNDRAQQQLTEAHARLDDAVLLAPLFLGPEPLSILDAVSKRGLLEAIREVTDEDPEAELLVQAGAVRRAHSLLVSAARADLFGDLETASTPGPPVDKR